MNVRTAINSSVFLNSFAVADPVHKDRSIISVAES